MAVVIRLARGGCRNTPKYRITVADSRFFRDHRFLEVIGYYNPAPKGQAKGVEINQERLNYWISKGAVPSDRVLNVLKETKKV